MPDIRRICLSLRRPRSLAAFPIALLLWMLRPIIRIRFRKLFSHLIGHLAVNTEMYLCNRDAGMNRPRTWNLFYVSPRWGVCNRYLLDMWSRVIPIVPLGWYADEVEALLQLLLNEEEDPDWNRMTERRNPQLLQSQPPHLKFTEQEIEDGEKALRDMGIQRPFVCLLGRDSAYKETTSQALSINKDYSYHAHRNVDIETYRPAMDYLAAEGYHVVRMGHIVEKPLLSRNPRIFDYASSGRRTEFLDLYLSSQCDFFVTTGTGLDGMAVVFRRPILLTNYVAYGKLPNYFPWTLAILKNFRDRKEDRWISYPELRSRGLAFAKRIEEFEAQNIDVVDNTQEELLAVCQEMVARMRNPSDTPGEEENALQAQFWEEFSYNTKWQLENPTLRIGSAFLKRHVELLSGKAETKEESIAMDAGT